ncbi:MAG: helix-turn-helix domain-containing protein [Gammaproteobacteria bacterium]
MRLSQTERDRLAQIARTTKDVRVLRRAQALLDLSAGDDPETVSRRYQVARSTVYNWIRRCQIRGLTDQALRDLPRPGRPRLTQDSK